MPIKLLFVEDSQLALKVMRRLVREVEYFEADFAETYAQAKDFLANSTEKYFAAVVDLNLPDAPKGEVVDLVLKHNIPTLVLTASYDKKRRDEFFGKGIVDYVVKETRYSYSYTIKLLIRLARNHLIKVLAVDDSLVARKYISGLLTKYKFNVYQADSAKSAIRTIIDNPDIKLVITDYNMPEVDGFELVRLLRGKYDKQELTVIGISGEGDASLSAKFIKNGANDFLRKPFNEEEFYCRVMHNVESLEAIEKIREVSHRDNLTGLYNREYFYQIVNHKIADCQQNDFSYCLAVIEIDNFDSFNNVHRDYGDNVLTLFAKKLAESFPDYITARLNGTQLVIFLWDISLTDSEDYMNRFREAVKSCDVLIEEQQIIHLSVCIGLSYSNQLDLVSLLAHCDELIQRAQEAGCDLLLSDTV